VIETHSEARRQIHSLPFQLPLQLVLHEFAGIRADGTRLKLRVVSNNNDCVIGESYGPFAE
jgi:hypothetical protein